MAPRRTRKKPETPHVAAQGRGAKALQTPNRAGRYLSIGVGVCGAIVLLGLAIPRGLVQFETLPTVVAVRTMERDVRTPSLRARVESVAAARLAAAAWMHQPAPMSELVRAALLLARSNAANGGSPAGRAALLRTARWAAETSLALRPLNIHAWHRYAQVLRASAGRPDAASAAAVLRGVQVQPHGVQLMPARLSQIIDHWSFFTPDQQQRLQGQFAHSVRVAPWPTARLARVPRKRALIRARLADNPAMLAHFEHLIAQEPTRGR